MDKPLYMLNILSMENVARLSDVRNLVSKVSDILPDMYCQYSIKSGYK